MSEPSRVPWPVTVIVLVGVVVLAIGGFLAWFHPAGLLPSGDPATESVRLLGQRMAARNLGLAIALAVALAVRAKAALAALIAVTALIEIGDVVGGLAQGDIAEYAGGLVVAAAFTWSAVRLHRTR